MLTNTSHTTPCMLLVFFEPYCPVDTVLLFTVLTALYLCWEIEYSFIHWVRTRLLKLKSGYQCFQSSHHAVKLSPVVSSSRAHLVTQSDCHTVSSVTANLPQARLVTVSWSHAIAQGQQPSCSDGRVRMIQSQSALGTTIKSVVLQVLHMDRPSPFRADVAPCRRHS